MFNKINNKLKMLFIIISFMLVVSPVVFADNTVDNDNIIEDNVVSDDTALNDNTLNEYDNGIEKEKETNMVEVVRCKDCKHATMTADKKMCKYCEMDTDDFGCQRDVYHDADWFCAYGERR